MPKCDCESWIQQLPIPGKIIILRCSKCHTDYTLFPNGQIQYEQRDDGLISAGATYVSE
jgi:hypothetical protein